MGNLREADYDFKRVWRSDRASLLRKSIAQKECACPLANAAYTNMLMDTRTLVRVSGRLLKQWVQIPGQHSVDAVEAGRMSCER